MKLKSNQSSTFFPLRLVTVSWAEKDKRWDRKEAHSHNKVDSAREKRTFPMKDDIDRRKSRNRKPRAGKKWKINKLMENSFILFSSFFMSHLPLIIYCIFPSKIRRSFPLCGSERIWDNIFILFYAVRGACDFSLRLCCLNNYSNQNKLPGRGLTYPDPKRKRVHSAHECSKNEWKLQAVVLRVGWCF